MAGPSSRIKSTNVAAIFANFAPHFPEKHDMTGKSAQKVGKDFLTRFIRAYAIAGEPGSPLQIPSVTQTREFARLVLPSLRKLRRDSEDIELAIATSEVESQFERWAKGRGVPSLAERKELISFVAAIASRLEP
jgi:hypothetical protein